MDCLSRAPVDESIDEHLDDKVLAALSAAAAHEGQPVIISVATPRDLNRWQQLLRTDEEAQPHLARARERKKGYKIFNNLLYYEDRLYVPKALRQRVFEEGHDDCPANHGGVRETLNRLKTYWWPQMSEEVAFYVSSCETCQRTKVDRRRPTGEMHSFEAYQPFQLVALDCLGPLPPSLANMRHVIVAVDSFSRFVDASAVADVQGATCATYLRSLIGRFGVPQEILTDNAPSFCNQHIKALEATFHFGHRKSTPHHHEGNAVVERVIQTLQQKIVTISHDPVHCTDWEKELPTAILSLNTSIHNTTGFSPFRLMFGRRKPYNSPIVEDQMSSHQFFANAQQATSEEDRRLAIMRQSDARDNARKYFEQHHDARSYDIGELVLARVMGRRSKLQERFQGPYRITKRCDDIYHIVNVDGRQERLERHAKDLRPFTIRQQESEHLLANERPPSDDNQNNQPRTNLDHNSSVPLQSTSRQSTTQSSDPPSDHINSDEQEQQLTEENPMFNNRLRVTLWLLSLTLSQATIRDNVAPALWLEEPIPVSPSPTTIVLKLSIGNPCGVLWQMQSEYADVQEAVAHCDWVYHDQITQRLLRLQSSRQRLAQATSPATQVVAKTDQSQVNPTAPVGNQGHASQQQQQHQQNQVHASQQQQYPQNQVHASKQHVLVPPQGTPSAHTSNRLKREWDPALILKAYNAPEAPGSIQTLLLIIDQSKEGEGERDKRQFGMGFVAGAFLCDVWKTIKDRTWGSKSEEELTLHEKSVDRALEAMVQQENVTQLRLRALESVMALQEQLVEHNVDQIAHFTSRFPVFSVIVSDVIARMHLLGSYLDRLRVSFRAATPDLHTLRVLLESPDILDGIEADTIMSKSVRFFIMNHHTIQMEFVAQRRTPDTSLYSVTAFKHWADLLTGKPKLYDYSGPRFVVYNRTSGCARGLEETPHAKYVPVTCAEYNYHDPRLANWRVIYEGDPFCYDMQTQVKQSYPDVYVNCFPLQIVINNRKLACPPHVFTLRMNENFTTKNFDYRPTLVGYTHNIMDTITDVEVFHFTPDSNHTQHGLNQTEAIEKIHKALKTQEELRAIAYVPSLWEGGPLIPHRLLLNAALIFAILLLMIIIYFKYKLAMSIARSRKAKKESARRRQARENPTALYGRGLELVPI